MEHALISLKYKSIAEELIETQPELAYIKISQCRIAYLVSDQCKKENKVKPCYADVEVIPKKFKWGMDADFAVTVYSPNVALFSEKQLKILIFQQLLRLEIEFNESSGAEKYRVREYDVNDFATIINLFGTGWEETQQELFEDLVDDPQA